MLVADFIEPGNIQAKESAGTPSVPPGHVLVSVNACGICGSDMHMYRNNTYRDELVRSTEEGYSVPGHEFAGVISEIGDDVTGWAIGERVVGVTGHGGGMAEYVVVPVNPFQLVRVPEGVSFQEAATTEPLADGLQMVRKAELKDSEHCIVFGVGIIGLGVIQSILARNIRPSTIIAIDVIDSRLEAAMRVGATHAIDAKAGNVFEQIGEITGFVHDAYRGESANVDVVFDCAGYIKHMKGPPPLQTALRAVSLNEGRIVCFGGFEDDMSIDFSPIILKQPVIIGSNGYAPEELVEALELMQTKVVDRAGLISHTFPLSEVSDAFEKQGEADAVKVMLQIAKR